MYRLISKSITPTNFTTPASIQITQSPNDIIYIGAGQHHLKSSMCNNVIIGLNSKYTSIYVPFYRLNQVFKFPKVLIHPKSKLFLVHPVTTAIFGASVKKDDKSRTIPTIKYGRTHYTKTYISRDKIRKRLMYSEDLYLDRLNLVERLAREYKVDGIKFAYPHSSTGMKRLLRKPEVVIETQLDLMRDKQIITTIHDQDIGESHIQLHKEDIKVEYDRTNSDDEQTGITIQEFLEGRIIPGSIQ